MKNLLLVLIALTSLPALAQINVSKEDAQLILDNVKWEKLGTRYSFSLSESTADCMTLNNYDNSVGFDCIIKDSSNEVDVSKRDLGDIVYWAGRQLSSSGLSVRKERAHMLCFSNTGCTLTNALSLSEMKHQYCNMSVHSNYDGELLEKTVLQEKIVPNSVSCDVEHGRDYLDNPLTVVNAKLTLLGDIGTTLEIKTFSSWSSFPGHIDASVACKPINDTFKNPHDLSATVERELIQRETTSIRNSNKGVHENVLLHFPGGVTFNGGESQATERGEFCSDI